MANDTRSENSSGRVVWSHCPGAATAPEDVADWFTDHYVSPEACDSMVSEVLTYITGITSPRGAWDAVFTEHATRQGLTIDTWRPGQKVVILVDNDNTTSQYNSPSINVAPGIVRALVTSLVSGGVSQDDIIVASPAGYIPDATFEAVRGRFPGVAMFDRQGSLGRTRVTYTPMALKFTRSGSGMSRSIADVFADATYIINLAAMKGCRTNGADLCATNWVQALERSPLQVFARQGYQPVVDLMGSPMLGSKCVLYLIDGLYGSRDGQGKPTGKWDIAPFNGEWPCSLLGSFDPVAIDAVAIDMLKAEYGSRHLPGIERAEACLLEAAQASNPPSGITYTPGGHPLNNLGVAEHWTPADYPVSHHHDRPAVEVNLAYRLLTLR